MPRGSGTAAVWARRSQEERDAIMKKTSESNSQRFANMTKEEHEAFYQARRESWTEERRKAKSRWMEETWASQTQTVCVRGTDDWRLSFVEGVRSTLVSLIQVVYICIEVGVRLVGPRKKLRRFCEATSEKKVKSV